MQQRRRDPVAVGEGRVLSLNPASPPLRGTSNLGRLAPRPGSLDGAVLAVVDDGFNSPGLPEAILARLRAAYALGDVVWAHKGSVSVPPNEDDWAVITSRATAGLALYGG
jgi:hypothetical protein